MSVRKYIFLYLLTCGGLPAAESVFLFVIFIHWWTMWPVWTTFRTSPLVT